MPSLLTWVSLFPLCRLFRSPSRRFDRLFRTSRPVLHDFRLPIPVELFNKLVAHLVGEAGFLITGRDGLDFPVLRDRL